ncbi:MAG: hypothetical protein CVU49_03435 [Candidatus Cloacimonetes bacterium HGW-Cloacimonetes-2]|jgi:poly-gamma-glutamate system protein|nr:MAG: hypothetical protein CVU49_03435 [Candidatus Cloacimonetes bacterium HGW-Cloacimonetes-2]
MYRPSLKSNWSLIILFLLALGLFVVAQTSYVNVKTENHDLKVEAAKLSQAMMDTLKAEIVARGIQIDPIDDHFNTGLIGTRLSSITTDRGLLSDKTAALNPNIAAIFIEEFTKLRLNEGDYVAVGLTGSNPGVAISLYAAMKTMKLNPRIITAVSSASYGANREEITWLDMETILKSKGMIDFSTSYASFGGKDDLGIGLSDNGIQSLQEAIRRNNLPQLIGANLNDNVQLRYSAYHDLLPEGERYRAFINIGRGLANVGSEPNANLIPEGINRKLAEKEFEQEGVMMLMAKKNVPVFHFSRLLRWTRNYDIPFGFEQIPTAGEGKVFGSRVHNVLIAAICLTLLAIAVIVVIVFDRHDRRFMANIVDPDEEL